MFCRWTLLFHKHKQHSEHLSSNVQHLAVSIQRSAMWAVASQRYDSYHRLLCFIIFLLAIYVGHVLWDWTKSAKMMINFIFHENVWNHHLVLKFLFSLRGCCLKLCCLIMLQVNNILSAIKRKKSLDTIILSLVAAVCTFLIFIYWLSKWGSCFCWVLDLCKLLYVPSVLSLLARALLKQIFHVVYFVFDCLSMYQKAMLSKDQKLRCSISWFQFHR